MHQMEAMVEDLAGVDSFSLLEDAFTKVDAAHQALSQLMNMNPADSGLRQNAPAFVPGEVWTGSQQSAFVD